MKKYFKFPAESDLGIGIQYIEFDDNSWPIRQVDCYGDRLFNSNERYHKELSCGGLCDQKLTEAGIKLGEQIDAEEFELAWKLSNRELVASRSSSKKESQAAMKLPVRLIPLEAKELVALSKRVKYKTILFHQIERHNWNLPQRLKWSLSLFLAGFGIATILGSVFTKIIITSYTHKEGSNAMVNIGSEEPISFKCSQFADKVIMIGGIGKTERPILNFNKKLIEEYSLSPINRCQMIASRFKENTENDRSIFITTGIKNGYDIICLSEGVGKGCLKDENGGQLLTLGRSGTHSSQKYLESLITSDSKEIEDFSIESTSSHAYIDLYKLIKDGRDYYKIDPS
jgi:Circadian oscillating protein COP23